MMVLDPDRTLALSYVPAVRRPALAALWNLDVALGAVLAGGREPMISRIKLAWWREALERLDAAPPPAEPVLEALAAEVLPIGVRGAQLAELEEGWSVLTQQEPLTGEDLAAYAAARGGLLFRYSARLLGGESSIAVEQGGEAWALADLARHSNQADAAAALEAARQRGAAPGAWPVRLRPLGMLAVLGGRDAERGVGGREQQGSPGRMLRMLGHRITGR